MQWDLEFVFSAPASITPTKEMFTFIFEHGDMSRHPVEIRDHRSNQVGSHIVTTIVRGDSRVDGYPKMVQTSYGGKTVVGPAISLRPWRRESSAR